MPKSSSPRFMTYALLSRLQFEYFVRRIRNPKYSMRAFARTLDIDPSLLNKILKKKRGISQDLRQKLSKRLGILRNEKDKNTAFQTIDDETLITLNVWYALPILELLHLKNFESDPKWIALKLGIPHQEALDAIEALIAGGLLIRSKNGSLIRPNQIVSMGHSKATAKVRMELQKSYLAKAIHSIDTIPPEKRENTSLTFACNKDQIEKMKTVIREFKDRVHELSLEATESDSVYHLSLALFPLTED